MPVAIATHVMRDTIARPAVAVVIGPTNGATLCCSCVGVRLAPTVAKPRIGGRVEAHLCTLTTRAATREEDPATGLRRRGRWRSCWRRYRRVYPLCQAQRVFGLYRAINPTRQLYRSGEGAVENAAIQGWVGCRSASAGVLNVVRGGHESCNITHVEHMVAVEGEREGNVMQDIDGEIGRWVAIGDVHKQVRRR